MSSPAPSLEIFPGNSEMAGLMRSFDWSQTPLGPVEGWPCSLRSAVTVMLGSRFPVCIFWGPELLHIYNDGFIDIAGKNHPGALGRPNREVWPEVWHINQPIFEAVIKGQPQDYVDLPAFLFRHGFLEETYFTTSFAPVPDDQGKVGGVLSTVLETTSRVLSERRMRMLFDLVQKTSQSMTERAAAEHAVKVMSGYPRDIPFALIYLLDPEGSRARLAGASHMEIGTANSPEWVDLDRAGSCPWPLQEVLRTGEPRIVEGLEIGVKQDADLSQVPVTSALVAPLISPAHDRPIGLLVLGITPLRPLDEDYRGFLSLARVQVVTLIGNARVREEELSRLEADLHMSQQAFKALVDHAPDIIARVDRELRHLYVNPAVVKVTGIPAEEFMGKTNQELGMPEELCALWTQMFNKAFDTQTEQRGEFTFPSRAGNIDYEIRAVPEFSADGQVRTVMSISRDISEQRRLEKHKLEFYRRTLLAATQGKLVITEEEEIAKLAGPPLEKWDFTQVNELPAIRWSAARLAQSMGMSKTDVYRLVSCVGEATSNAFKHAGGGAASLHQVSGGLLFMTRDRGNGIDTLNLPNVALVRGYSTTGTGGLGYTMILASADKLYLSTGPAGTVVAASIAAGGSGWEN